ncbi:unnamed protein product [Withania somnifera]
MGTSTESDNMGGLKKGPWNVEEDEKLLDYIQQNGHRNWRALPKLAGLNRCGKSCRLLWTNYLRPGIKRGKFFDNEEKSSWSAIAKYLSGRTDNEIKNHWNTHLRKKLLQMGIDPVTHMPRTDPISLINAVIGNLPPQLISAAASNSINTSCINRQFDMNSTLNNFLFPDTAQVFHQIQWLQSSSLLGNSLISNANANANGTTSPLTNIEALNQILGSQNNLFDWNHQLEKYYNSILMNYQKYLSHNSSEESLTGKNDGNSTGGSEQLMVSGTSSSLGNVISAKDQILKSISEDDVPDELGIIYPECPSSTSIEMPKENTSNMYPKQELITMIPPSSASSTSTYETWEQIMGDEKKHWRDIKE